VLSLGLLFGQAVPAFADVLFNQDIPVAGTFTNPCNGDVFPFAGTIHVVFHETIDSSGGIHFDLMQNGFDIKSTAPAVPSGSSYVITVTVLESINLTAGVAEEATITEHLNVISQGPAPNFLLHVTLHVTLVNGVPTAQVNNFREECTP
jgi:hypothetical protein